jgi:deoxyribonuclease V
MNASLSFWKIVKKPLPAEEKVRINLTEAAETQRRLASKLILKWERREVNLIAGADFGYDSKREKIAAVIVVFAVPGLEIVESTWSIQKVQCPYIPGFLSLREGPAFFQAFKKIKNRPDVTLVDGNGIAHPRMMGLASYVGVLLDIPTVGCAKKPFFPFDLPADGRGSSTIYRNKKNEKVGICLRTRSGVKPVFVSPGHRTNFQFARNLVLRFSKFRIPEPLREAHRLASSIFES